MGVTYSGNTTSVKILSTVAVARVALISSARSSSPKPLTKRISNMNLIPQEVHKQWFQSEESRCEREKLMLVLCTSPSPSVVSKLVIIDVEAQSASFGKIVQQLVLPFPGDELVHCALVRQWTRRATEGTNGNGFYLSSAILPCHNTGRIYIIGVDNRLQMRVRKFLSKEELWKYDLQVPLGVCNGPASTKGPRPLVSFLAGKDAQPKGEILCLDRKLIGPLDEQQAEGGGTSSLDSPQSPLSSSAKHQRPKFGGQLVLHASQGHLFTTESFHPRLLNEHLPFGEKLADDDLTGSSINVWDAKKRAIKQIIRLDAEDGRMPMCLRMFHHPELNHGYVCSAIGGSIFHVHRSTKTGLFQADRVSKLPPLLVDGWLADELPAFPVDMVISMDDSYLYVACWLQGYVAQFHVSDPFRPTLLRKFHLGGVLQQKSSSAVVLHPPQQTLTRQPTIVGGSNFEGGPARLQLSLDGRRLYVSNSTMRVWNEQFYSGMRRKGSSIALLQIDLTQGGEMRLEESFGVHFKLALESSGANGSSEPLYAGEMRFLNGDSTSADIF